MVDGFTVIMPTFNQAAFIRRAIHSLQYQIYENWELIIINDGCTDNTEDILSEFSIDKRIHFIKNKGNQGLGHALNQGLDVAIFDHIAYLPSDDFFTKII
jgi:glycosyltransferase involved in cell wall biosynthesis